MAGWEATYRSHYCIALGSCVQIVLSIVSCLLLFGSLFCTLSCQLLASSILKILALNHQTV